MEKKLAIAILLFAIVLDSTLAQTIALAHGTVGSATANTMWLNICGRHVCNANGETIGLSGVNVATGGRTEFRFGLADLQKIKSLGFRSFRIPLPWSRLQPQDERIDRIDDTYLVGGRSPLYHGLDELLKWAIQENLYLIVALYWTPDNPTPAWAFPGISDESEKYEALLTGAAERERTGIINTWKYIAARYSDVPNIIFEILIEPFVSDDDMDLAGNAYKTFNEAIISAIESVEEKPHLKLVQLLREQQTWEEIVDEALDVSKNQVLWATNYYSPQLISWSPDGKFWHGQFAWQGQTFQEGSGTGSQYIAYRITRVANRIRDWNKPWIVTESGREITQIYLHEWYDTVFGIAREYSPAGWITHLYCSDPEFEANWNIGNPSTEAILMPILTTYVPSMLDGQASASTTITSTSTGTSGSTVTSTSATTTTTPPQTGMPFPVGQSILAGLVGGIVALVVIRRRKTASRFRE